MAAASTSDFVPADALNVHLFQTRDEVLQHASSRLQGLRPDQIHSIARHYLSSSIDTRLGTSLIASDRDANAIIYSLATLDFPDTFEMGGFLVGGPMGHVSTLTLMSAIVGLRRFRCWSIPKNLSEAALELFLRFFLSYGMTDLYMSITSPEDLFPVHCSLLARFPGMTKLLVSGLPPATMYLRALAALRHLKELTLYLARGDMSWGLLAPLQNHLECLSVCFSTPYNDAFVNLVNGCSKLVTLMLRTIIRVQGDPYKKFNLTTVHLNQLHVELVTNGFPCEMASVDGVVDMMLFGTTNMAYIPHLTDNNHLSKLELSNCDIERLPACSRLESIRLVQVHKLESLPSCANVQTVKVEACNGLTSIDAFVTTSGNRLTTLRLMLLPGLKSIPDMKTACPVLDKLELVTLDNLTTVGHLPLSVTDLRLQNLPKWNMDNHNIEELQLKRLFVRMPHLPVGRICDMVDGSTDTLEFLELQGQSWEEGSEVMRPRPDITLGLPIARRLSHLQQLNFAGYGTVRIEGINYYSRLSAISPGHNTVLDIPRMWESLSLRRIQRATLLTRCEFNVLSRNAHLDEIYERMILFMLWNSRTGNRALLLPRELWRMFLIMI